MAEVWQCRRYHYKPSLSAKYGANEAAAGRLAASHRLRRRHGVTASLYELAGIITL